MSKSAVTTPSSHSMREKCFLCEVPRGPWAMLHNFMHPVFRACCNYEGTDRIAEVLDKAKHMRQAFNTALPVSEAMALKVSHADSRNCREADDATQRAHIRRHSAAWEGAGQHGGSKRCTFPRADSSAGSQRGSRCTDAVCRHAASPHARSGADTAADSRLYHSEVRPDQGHAKLPLQIAAIPCPLQQGALSHRTCYRILCRFQENRLRSQSLHRVPHRLSDRVPERLWYGETDVLRVP